MMVCLLSECVGVLDVGPDDVAGSRGCFDFGAVDVTLDGPHLLLAIPAISAVLCSALKYMRCPHAHRCTALMTSSTTSDIHSRNWCNAIANECAAGLQVLSGPVCMLSQGKGLRGTSSG